MSESIGAPGSQASLREANSARILDAVKIYGQLTQVDLAAATGLSPATVSNIVKQLLAAGVVETRATTRSGRRAQLVTLKRLTSLAVGIHVRPRSLDVSLVDTALDTVAHHTMPLPPEHRHDTTLDRAALLIGEVAEAHGATLHEIVGVGVAMPASSRPGVPVALPIWEDVDVAHVLQRRVGAPVFIERETDAAAVAEARLGALRGVTCGVYVRVGEVTDSAIVQNGGLLAAGTTPPAGLGHVRVAPGGAICRCGARGCLNTVVSLDALRESLRLSHGPLSLRAILQAAASGDRGCQQVIADAGVAIGDALADLVTVLGPEKVVIGGPLAQAGDLLLGPVADALAGRPLIDATDGLVSPSAVPGHAETLGVVARVFEQVVWSQALEGAMKEAADG